MSVNKMEPTVPAQCFPPLATSRSRILILGSFPGVRSLEQQQYYAHPRNAFWPIMGELLGFDPLCAYPERVQVLLDRGIALWDVLFCCQRVGSLDTAIEPASIRINDFEGFFAAHRRLQAVFFNGRRAEQEFNKAMAAAPAAVTPPRQLVRLPSTSPAMASLRFAEKMAAWRVVCCYI